MWKDEDVNIIAFDTSCDETSVAVLHGRKVLSSIISSQTELHKKWGGVVPDVARRAHQENIVGTYNEALKRAGLKIQDLEAVAVTIGPGLAIDLEVGIDFAKNLAIENKLPFIPVNHMEGHLLSSLLLNSVGNGYYTNDPNDLLPFIGMLASGKHTELVYVEKFGEYKKLGQTLDDAAGEAFDKVGRMLGFGYPGGPIVSEFAKNAPGKEEFGLPVPMEKSGDLNFSYSGLKTACLYKIKQLREDGRKDKDFVNDFCNEFVRVVSASIVLKVRKALKENSEVKNILVGGGVFNNEYLVRSLAREVRLHDADILVPEARFRGDNGAMIGIAALRMFNDGDFVTSPKRVDQFERIPRYSIEDVRKIS